MQPTFCSIKIAKERRFPNGTGVNFPQAPGMVDPSFLINKNKSTTPGVLPGVKSVKSLERKRLQMVVKGAMVAPLLDYANKVGSPNLPEYIAVSGCSRSINQEPGNKLKASYRCGSRLCLVCNTIRQEKAVELYLPVLRQIDRVGFLVLTHSSKHLEGADSSQVREHVKRLTKELASITRAFARVNERTPDYLMSIEANPEGWKKDKKTERTYWAPCNPHINLVGRYSDLEAIRNEWIARSSIEFRDPQNQRLEEKGTSEKCLRECIKYPLKVFLNPPKSEGGRALGKMNVRGVDVLVSAFKGLRRVRQSGLFYAVKDEGDKISQADISELDLQAQSYNDLPTTGESDELVVQWDGSLLPSSTEMVVYTWNDKLQNWFFTSLITGEKYALVPGSWLLSFSVLSYSGKDG